MSRKHQHPTHRAYRRSWWDGSVIALCGARAEAGTYNTYRLWSPSGPQCGKCDRLHHQGKKK